MSLLSLMEGLVAADLRVVLVGGMAVRAHGVLRVTDDVDVCYDAGYLNERALVRVLREWNAYPRDHAPGRKFTMSRTELQRNDTMHLRTVHGDLDLMRELPGIGAYADVIAYADTLRFASGLAMPVINLEKLIRSKELANREKDVEVLHELRAVRALKLAQESGLGDITPSAPLSSPSPTRRGRPKR